MDLAAYDRHMPRLVARIRRVGRQPAEVQVHLLDEYAWAATPAEYFGRHGLRIKEQAYPAHAAVAGHADGMVGYVPHRKAFRNGIAELKEMMAFADVNRSVSEIPQLMIAGLG